MEHIFNEPLELYFSEHELFYLYSLMNASFVMDHNNPYLGLLAEEIEAYKDKAFESLKRRRLIRQNILEEWILDPLLSILVEAVVRADHSISIDLTTSEGDRYHHFYHLWDSLIVQVNEHEFKRRSLKLCTSFQALTDDFISIFSQDSAFSQNGKSFEVPGDAVDGFFSKLDDDGDSVDLAPELINSLRKRDFCCSLVYLLDRKHISDQKVRGFSFAGADDTLWLVHRKVKSTGSYLSFETVDLEELEETFVSFLPKEK